MTNKTRDRSLGDGVYFAEQDNVGTWKRLGILVVDGIILFIALTIMGTIYVATSSHFSNASYQILCIGISWLYLVPLKRSRYRTIGYRIFRAKIVTYQGKPPSLYILTFREAMWLLSFGNLILDFIWSNMDEHKQTYRDRMLQLYLVKNSAKPIGKGEIHLNYFFAFSYIHALPNVMASSISNNSTS